MGRKIVVMIITAFLYMPGVAAGAFAASESGTVGIEFTESAEAGHKPAPDTGDESLAGYIILTAASLFLLYIAKSEPEQGEQEQ